MDWQSIIIVLVIASAVLYLGWSYFRSRTKRGGCAECLAQHKLSLKKHTPAPPRHER